MSTPFNLNQLNGIASNSVGGNDSSSCDTSLSSLHSWSDINAIEKVSDNETTSVASNTSNSLGSTSTLDFQQAGR